MTPIQAQSEMAAMTFARLGASRAHRGRKRDVRREIERRRVEASDRHEQQLEVERRVVDAFGPAR